MDYKSKIKNHNGDLKEALNDIIALPTYDEGYDKGKTDGYNQCTEDMQDDLQAKYDEGFAAGAEKVKTEEARTDSDITVDGATVKVASGYYLEDKEKTVDTTPFYEEGYQQCTNDMQDDLEAKYTEGVAAGKEAIKTEEARTESDVTVIVSQDAVDVTIPSGYYGNSVVLSPNVDPIYDAGFEAGLAEGGGSSEDFEALGALCDWDITTNEQSIPIVTICNYHPSYFLHCHISARGGNLDDDYVVDPDDCRSILFDDAFSAIQPVYVRNVRWSANA